jgi:hypothetical protein
MPSSMRRRALSNWAYVAMAYTLVWGSIAIYAVLLARRVAQTRDATTTLRETLESERQAGDGSLCDTPPAR